jgi:WD40 repeat protein
LWKVSTGEVLKTFIGHTSAVNSINLSNENNFLISGSNDKTLKLWDVKTGECIRTYYGHSDFVLAVRYLNE